MRARFRLLPLLLQQILVLAVDIVCVRVKLLCVEAIAKAGARRLLAPLNVRVHPVVLCVGVRLLVLSTRAPVFEPVAIASCICNL